MIEVPIKVLFKLHLGALASFLSRALTGHPVFPALPLTGERMKHTKTIKLQMSLGSNFVGSI